jgi:general secretion pathway protein G
MYNRNLTGGIRGARTRFAAFSLIELVIVVVIIAIIGAIAIPKMSRGAAGAGDSAVIQDLSVLRSALDLYQTENGGLYPLAANVVTALTTFSDGAGNVNPTKTAVFIYGPYLRSIPPLPVGAAKGGTLIAAATATNVGWIYTVNAGQTTATIQTNTTGTEVDAKGALYTSY